MVSARYCEGAVEVEGGHQQNTYNVLSVQLAPGVAVRLTAGERTTWTVTDTVRKIWVA